MSDIEASVDQLRRVLSDPGSVIRRGVVDGTSWPPEYEPLASWQARAILAQFSVFPIKQRKQQPVTLDADA